MTLALIVFVAQVANQTVAAATACSIPLLFAKIGLDPTLGTSNLVVTMSDLLGFALFLTLVDLLL
jgi:magnesium transporter